jgi:hypothetical protein
VPDESWITEVDNWLVSLGRFVFEQIRLELAPSGFEVGFPKITAEQTRIDGIPAVRNEGYLVPVGDKLEWYSPTSGASS